MTDEKPSNARRADTIRANAAFRERLYTERGKIRKAAEEACKAADLPKLLRQLIAEIELWVDELKVETFNLFEDTGNGHFARDMMRDISTISLEPAYATLPFTLLPDARDLVEFTLGWPRAKALADRFEAFDGLREQFSQAVSDLARVWDHSPKVHLEEFMMIDRCRSNVKLEALDLCSYIENLANFAGRYDKASKTRDAFPGIQPTGPSCVLSSTKDDSYTKIAQQADAIINAHLRHVDADSLRAELHRLTITLQAAEDRWPGVATCFPPWVNLSQRVNESELYDAILPIIAAVARNEAIKVKTTEGALREVQTAEPAVASEPDYFFRQRGEGWQLRFAGHETQWLRPAIGYAYLRELLQFPNRTFSVSQLLVAVHGEKAVLPLGDGGKDLDLQAKKAYAIRLQELDEELEEAHEKNDIGMAEKLGTERTRLLEQVKQAGFRGTAKRSNSDLNNIRNSVCNAINRALVTIKKYEPAAFTHLKSSISTGFSVVYRPSNPTLWSF